MANPLIFMVGGTGIEPVTSTVWQKTLFSGLFSCKPLRLPATVKEEIIVGLHAKKNFGPVTEICGLVCEPIIKKQPIGLFRGLLITIYKTQFSEGDFSPSRGVGSFMKHAVWGGRFSGERGEWLFPEI
jgi:hypothetical protein